MNDQVPGLLTMNINAMVNPRKTSNATKRLVGNAFAAIKKQLGWFEKG
jgi:hypothetical protein